MDRKELLKGMLHDVINDRMEQASVTMHDYFVAKTREVAGLGSAIEADELEVETTQSEGTTEAAAEE